MIKGWWSTATAIGQAGKLAALMFGVLTALGLLVKAAGGSTWLAIAFSGVGVIGALVALGLGAAEVQAQRREAADSLWSRPPMRLKSALADDGMYRLGVDHEAREALEAVGVDDDHAPYVARDVDAALCERLEEAAGRTGVSLVVLRGPSKAGKSRTLTEALHTLARRPTSAFSDAVLVEPARPTENPAALVTLASAPPPRELKANVPNVIWLDDLEPFVTADANGLNARTLQEWFVDWARPILVVATSGGKGASTGAASGYGEPLANLLRVYPPLELNPWLSLPPHRGASGSEVAGRSRVGVDISAGLPPGGRGRGRE